MANLSVQSTGVRIEESIFQMTQNAAEDLSDVAAVALDANGDFVEADAATDGVNNVWGVSVEGADSGYPATAIRQGVIVGLDLDGLAYGDPVFLSDTPGALADVAGTVSIQVGHVIPIAATTLGVAHDKALLVDVRGTNV